MEHFHLQSITGPLENFQKLVELFPILQKLSFRDDLSKRQGNENYRPSLERLLNAIDTFIREKTKGFSSAGKRENFDLKKNCHFTIFLLWQIRNAITHQGGIIDKKCKVKYDRIYRKKELTVTPVIELPDTLNVGDKFFIGFTEYVEVWKCASAFFRENVSEEDLNIFKSRASMTNTKIVNAVIPLEFESGTLYLDVEKATTHGFIIDQKSWKIFSPEGTVYLFDDGKIYLPNGESFLSKFEKSGE